MSWTSPAQRARPPIRRSRTGLKVSALYIAQVKQKHGIIERECYNVPKSEGDKVPQCPEEKVEAIEEALRHFGMILP